MVNTAIIYSDSVDLTTVDVFIYIDANWANISGFVGRTFSVSSLFSSWMDVLLIFLGPFHKNGAL